MSPDRPTWRTSRVVLLAIIGFLVAGCGSARSNRTTTDELLEFRGLSDWRSYADQVSVIQVKDETADPTKRSLVTRHLSIAVEETLWSRGAPSNVRTLFDFGWVVTNGQRHVDAPSQGVRLEVGGRYVVALARFNDGWSPLTRSSVMRLQGEVIRVGSHPAGGGQALDGLSVDELSRQIAAAQPDPLAEEYKNLPPLQRIRRVNEERARSGRSTSPSSGP